MEERTVLFGKYEVGKLLGKGTFAKVHHGRQIATNESVAIKVISKDQVKKEGMMEQIKREIEVMRLVRHPNVVELKEVMATKTKIFFVMEYVRGGELFAKVAKGKLKEDQARKYFQQLISAVDFCHSRGVSHRDLKPENLLLDENGDLKISDFGLSALPEQLRNDGLLHTRCGTPAYVAPEVLRRKGYDGKTMARLSQMSPFQFTIFSLLSSFALILVSGENLGFHSTVDRKLLGLQKEKLTHVRLYWHDIVGGSHPSAIEVVPAPSNESQTNFGSVRMFDNALTEGPELSSKLVARAQGFYGFAGQVELSLLMAQNFAFVAGEFNGSTITLLGRNSILNKVRELPVIGGSGAFRFARGYAELRTHIFNLTSGDAIVEYNIYVLHY